MGQVENSIIRSGFKFKKKKKKEQDYNLIEVCDYCGKVDIDKNHYKDCIGPARQEREDNIWK